MSEPSVDRALGALDGRVTSLERWIVGLDGKLDDAADGNHELATQVALMRQSMEQLSESAKVIKGMREDMQRIKGVGRIALGIMFALGGVGGSIAGSIGAVWIKKLFGWE